MLDFSLAGLDHHVVCEHCGKNGLINHIIHPLTLSLIHRSYIRACMHSFIHSSCLFQAHGSMGHGWTDESIGDFYVGRVEVGHCQEG